MPHSFGKRARTRHLFARNFREHGMIRLSTFMKTYKVGDYVDIKANAACQKGMPYRFYHGKTGVVFNVSPRALGVVVNKQVGNRFIEKRINIRIEHVIPSKCRDGFLARARANTKAATEAKSTGVKAASMKRQPILPASGHFVTTKNNEPVMISPVPYEILI
jgi:large subunit ribosomal protein L21e